MQKLISSALVLFFAVQSLSAQKNELLVRKDDNNLYLVHKVVPRENFYSVSRLYNVSPRSIASYNKLDMNKGLNIDQKIRIPLTDSNFTQQGNSGTPVYYKVNEKDGLLKISKDHKDVSLQHLRAWNNLTGDEIKKGEKLIIGFLISNEMASVTLKNPIKKEEPIVKTEENSLVKEPVEIKPEVKPEVKEETKDPEPVKVIEENSKPVPLDQGYFRSFFQQQVKSNPVSKNETVTAGIFKTTSGWQDAKYYLLIDKVQPGTIVKLINPSNNTAIYAKVLGEMSGIRQNEGLNIRISNAAASALQIDEQDKFIVKVSY